MTDLLAIAVALRKDFKVRSIVKRFRSIGERLAGSLDKLSAIHLKY